MGEINHMCVSEVDMDLVPTSMSAFTDKEVKSEDALNLVSRKNGGRHYIKKYICKNHTRKVLKNNKKILVPSIYKIFHYDLNKKDTIIAQKFIR